MIGTFRLKYHFLANMRYDRETWSEIVEGMPLLCINLIVHNKDGEFLLGYRVNDPATDMWYVPGSRLLKNERAEDAVHRIADEELSTDVEIQEFLGHYEEFFPRSVHGGETGQHAVTLNYRCTVSSEAEVSPDEQHTDLRWFSSPPKSCHEYTLDYLDMADLI